MPFALEDYGVIISLLETRERLGLIRFLTPKISLLKLDLDLYVLT